jgi:DNA polymerase III sliding clamp (beta) subunit (PCNA family)
MIKEENKMIEVSNSNLGILKLLSDDCISFGISVEPTGTFIKYLDYQSAFKYKIGEDTGNINTALSLKGLKAISSVFSKDTIFQFDIGEKATRILADKTDYRLANQSGELDFSIEVASDSNNVVVEKDELTKAVKLLKNIPFNSYYSNFEDYLFHFLNDQLRIIRFNGTELGLYSIPTQSDLNTQIGIGSKSINILNSFNSENLILNLSEQHLTFVDGENILQVAFKPSSLTKYETIFNRTLDKQIVIDSVKLNALLKRAKVIGEALCLKVEKDTDYYLIASVEETNGKYFDKIPLLNLERYVISEDFKTIVNAGVIAKVLNGIQDIIYINGGEKTLRFTFENIPEYTLFVAEMEYED